MATLVKCIKKFGKSLSKSDIQFVEDSKQEYQDRGISAKDATINAVEDLIQSSQEKVASYENEIREKGGFIDDAYSIDDEIAAAKGVEVKEQKPVVEPVKKEVIKPKIAAKPAQDKTKYQGDIPKEKTEWEQATQKFGKEGMTKEARMKRAEEMGFDTQHVGSWIIDSKAKNQFLENKKAFDDAYNAGLKAKSIENAPDWIFGMSDKNNMDNTSLRVEAFELGLIGKYPEIVAAERIGDIPEAGFSTNFSEDTGESGVSVLGLLDNNTGGFLPKNNKTFELFNPGEHKKIIGFLHPNKTGSDGEALLLMPVDPAKIRSIHAAFDQDKAESSNILFSLEDQGFSKKEADMIDRIGFGRKTKKEKFADRYNKMKENALTKFRQNVVDQFASFRSILKDEKSWMLSHLTASASGALEATIKVGQPYMDKSGVVLVDTNKKSLDEALEPLGEHLDRWTYWMAGNRAARLMSEGRENLFTKEDIQTSKSLNKGNEKLFESVRKDFEELGNAVTNIGVKSGLINKNEAMQWAGEGFYLPFYRVLESEGARGPKGIYNSGLVRQQAFKELKGGTSQLDDLLTNVLANWNHLLSASLKNQAATGALKTAVELKMAKIVPKAKKSKDAIYIRDNGQEVWYEVSEPLVLDSLMSLNWEGLNGRIMKTARAFKRALTIGVTASPEFKIRNLIRDSIHAMAVTDISTNIAKNLHQGWKATSKDSDISANMLASGGSFGQSGYIHGSDPDAVKRLLKVSKTNKSIKESILDSPSKFVKVWDAYQDFGARLENINRAADYSQAIDQGVDRLTAAFNARDHLDFTRTGSATVVRGLAQIVPFLNARLQGLDKMARSAPKTTRQWLDPREATKFKAVIGIYSMMGTALYLMMKDDDDYKEAEEWEKRTYHLFKVPGSETLYRIPRPFEVGAIAYMIESVAQQMVDDKVHGKLFAERLGHTLKDTLSFDPIPQILKPALEVAMNKNTFTDRPIESMSMERLSPSKRKKAWTSETAIAMSEGMDAVSWGKVVLSPVQIEHLVRGYLGWAGATGIAATDSLLVRPATSAPVAPAVKFTEYPLIKAFVKTKPARNTQYTTEFYKKLNEINVAYADIQDARKRGDIKDAQELLIKNQDKLALRKFYNKQSRKLSHINKRMQKVRMSHDFTAIEKRNELDRLTLMKNFITKLVADVEDERNN